MGLFKNNTPNVEEIILQKDFPFMYENFVFSTQHKLYLLLEEKDGLIDALTFDIIACKYGYPNDEIAHPLQKHGLGFYGFFEVHNSPWIQETLNLNRQHPSHHDKNFLDDKHYIAKFKDVTLEVISRKQYELVQICKEQLIQLMINEIELIKNDDLD